QELNRRGPRARTVVSSERVERIRHALQIVLSEREREVVITTLQYFNVELGRSVMPPEAVSELAQRLGVTTASIRKTRERTYEKLRAWLQSTDSDSTGTR